MESTITNALGTETTFIEQSNQRRIRFFALSVSVILMAIDLWLIVSLIHFGIKTRKWRQLKASNPDSLSSGRIYLSVVICSVIAFLYHLVGAVDESVLFYYDDEWCDSIGDLFRTLYGLCLLSVIFFLWFRQRVFYTSFLPTARFTKCLKVFSFSIIFISFFFVVISLTLWNIPNDKLASPIGCVYRKDGNFRFPSLIIAFTTIIFSQISLLAVFIHALLASQKSSVEKKWKLLLCCRPIPSIEHINATEPPNHRTQTIVHNVIRKTTIFAALSLLCDVLVIFVTFLLQLLVKRSEIISVLTSISVSLNLYFVILSFVAWKDMITSPCRLFASHDVTSSTTAHTGSGNTSETRF